MAGCWNLLDPLSKDSPTPHQVQNLCLIERHFNRARPNEIRRAMNIGKHRVHLSPFQEQKGAAAATPIKKFSAEGASASMAVAPSAQDALVVVSNPANPPASTEPSPRSAARCSG